MKPDPELFTLENAVRGALVVSALKAPALPFLDKDPGMTGDLWKDALQVVKGARNGMWYGARIRFVHSLVMAILFSKDSVRKNLVKCLANAWGHARNLGTFALIFKALLAVLRRVSGANRNWHSALAGLLGGSYVWSTDDPIVVQINLYLLSRILFGSVKIAGDSLGIHHNPAEVARNYHVFGSLIWAAVMYLFYNHPLKLQRSLTSSMQEIYKNSDSIGPGSIQP